MSWREDVDIDNELRREMRAILRPETFDVEALDADPLEPGRFAWIAAACSRELADTLAAAHNARTGQQTRVV